MGNTIISNIKVVAGQSALTDAQKIQFKQVMVDGFKKKFLRVLGDDNESIFKIVELWEKYSFMPMDETFCAIDRTTDEVLSIVLLNNFKKSSLLETLLCFIKWSGVTGFIKAYKVVFSFLKLDGYNKNMNDSNVVAEIYLVATRENKRGQGVGTLLLKHVLEYLQLKCRCEAKNTCTCRIKLLAFGNGRPLKLYERLGFSQVKIVATPDLAKAFGDEEYENIVWMEKPVLS